MLLSTPPLARSQTQPQLCKLPSGATIIAEQIPVAAVNLNVWFRVGSAWETDAINGMAHFLEHMIFKGSSCLAEGQFEQLVEEHGGSLNAATAQEYTHFYLTVAPQDLARLAPWQLELVLNAAIPEEAFERERAVVLEEIRRSEDNLSRRTYKRAMELCFPELPYSRPVLGPAAVIAALQVGQMRQFHRQWYRPETMTVSVVGNLPVETLMETVVRSLEHVEPSATRPLPERDRVLALNPEPSFTTIVRAEVSEPRSQHARLVMMWRVPGWRAQDETYALDVLAGILGQGRLSRFFQDLREGRQLVRSIGVSNMTHLIQGVFYIAAQLPPEQLATVETAIREHIVRVQNEPVAAQELQRIRTQVANRFIFANEQPSDRANLYGYYHSQLGSIDMALSYPQHIREVTAEAVQTAAQRYLNPEAYGIVTVRPEA